MGTLEIPFWCGDSPIEEDMSTSFTFELLTKTDLPVLVEWFTRPHVNEVWKEAPSLADAEAKYLPRMDDESDVRPYLAFEDHVPIGYIQSYVAVETEDGWWPGQHDRGWTGGVDAFGPGHLAVLGIQRVTAPGFSLPKGGEAGQVASDPMVVGNSPAPDILMLPGRESDSINGLPTICSDP
jgi:hypothetical protein